MEDQAEIVRRFEQFYSDFIDDNGNRKYDILISQMELNASISLVIDYDDLLRFDAELARGLLNAPELYIDLASMAIRHRLRIINEEYANSVEKFHARFRNLEPINRIDLRKIRANHIGKLIQVSGILTRVNKVSPLMIRGVFRCLNCNDAIISIDQEDNEFTRPLVCPQCNRKGPFKLLQDRSTFIDWQKIRIQEKPEELPAGQMPRFIDGYLLEDIVDVARPGDRVTIIGILKAKQESTQQGKLTIFRTFLDVNYIEKHEVEIESLEITPEQEEEIKELAKDPWIYRKLIRSIVPSIYGMDEIKEALLLQLFSGVSRQRNDGTVRRGEIHILLVGDPGVGKSQILKSIAEIAPRGIYTSGKGTTAAGLCVAGDSLLFLDTGPISIQRFVENEFKTSNQTDVLITNEQNFTNIVYNNVNSRNEILYSHNLKIKKQNIEKVWKITSPKYMIKITTKTGREIKLTPQTCVLCYDDFFNICWKSASFLKFNDKIAIAKKLKIRNKKNIPLIIDFLKDFPEKIKILNFSPNIFKINDYIKIKNQNNKNFHLQELLNCCNSSKINSLKEFPKRLLLENEGAEKIYLPIQFNDHWFYIMGIIFGNENILTKNNSGFIIEFKLSEIDNSIIKNFIHFFKNLKIKLEIIECSQSNKIKIHVISSFISHILSKFGLFEPLEISEKGSIPKYYEFLYYPEKLLRSFLKGVFDSGGVIRNDQESPIDIWFNNKISHESRENLSLYDKNFFDDTDLTLNATSIPSIFLFSENKNKLRFIQNALSKFNIFSSIVDNSDLMNLSKIIKSLRPIKNNLFLVINEPRDLFNFSIFIDFNCKYKKRKFQNSLEEVYNHFSNFNVKDNMPYDLNSIKKLLNFYDYNSVLFGTLNLRKNNDNNSMRISKKMLRHLLKNIRPDLLRHKIRLPENFEIELTKIFNTKNELSQSLKEKILFDKLKQQFDHIKDSGIISIKLLIEILEKMDSYLAPDIKDLINKIIKNAKIEHEKYLEFYKILKHISRADILWDEITDIEIFLSEDHYVYDLTIPGSHNFIANGFIVHNTAAVIRDKDTGNLSLEAGVLVLSDGGLAAIDEFDKMRPEDRVAIHEAMEQLSISVAKAGIITTLNSRTSILAAANPYYGRYDEYKTVAENIKRLPPTILSRFDLIFLIRDRPDQARDERMAEFILNQEETPPEPPISHDLLKNYIYYARKNCKPSMTREAVEEIKRFYLQTRAAGADPDTPVPITARYLEALIRLAEARAKMALHEEVTAEDAQAVIQLMRFSLSQVGIDQETGISDIDAIETGITTSRRRRLDQLNSLIRQLVMEKHGEAVSLDEIKEAAARLRIPETQIEEEINNLRIRGVIYQPREGYFKPVEE